MTVPCVNPRCNNVVSTSKGFCDKCYAKHVGPPSVRPDAPAAKTMAEKYPAYFKDVSDIDEIDVYQTHNKFGIEDPSGCIHHASKKLLLSGARTGGKSAAMDVKEARDTLTRYLQINGIE